MSVMASDSLPCPSCGTPTDFEVCFSVNGGRHAHLRRAVLDGSFQRQTCAECGVPFRLDPEFTYFDAGRAQWVLVRPPSESRTWAELETTALDVFASAFGAGAPPAARAIGAQLSPRVVFGWPALREKLVCADLGLDDVTLELTKLALLRGLEDSPLEDGVELRLIDADADSLRLGWVRAADEVVVETLSAPRELYAEIGADAAWAPLRSALTAGPFVDVDRLLVEPA